MGTDGGASHERCLSLLSSWGLSARGGTGLPPPPLLAARSAHGPVDRRVMGAKENTCPPSLPPSVLSSLIHLESSFILPPEDQGSCWGLRHEASRVKDKVLGFLSGHPAWGQVPLPTQSSWDTLPQSPHFPPLPCFETRSCSVALLVLNSH